LLFFQLALSSTCHKCQLAICQLAIFVNLSFGQLAILLTCHLVNLLFVNFTFCPLAILTILLSLNSFIHLPLSQPAIFPSCHFGKTNSVALSYHFVNLLLN
jgi:hypothetical protein